MAIRAENPAVRRKKTALYAHVAQNWFIYTIFAAVLAYYLIFKYIPMYGVLIAFKKYSPADGIMGSRWVGLVNFERFFSSVYFTRIFRNTIFLNLYILIFSFPAPVLFALMLNELRSRFFKRAVQTISYLPHFISLVIMAGMMVDFLNDSGAISTLIFRLFGIRRRVWLNELGAYRTIYVVSEIWKSLGWNAIIYLASLSNIDTELYDAAVMDGCGSLRKMWHVTLPGLAPTIIILLIMRIGSMLSIGSEKTLLLYNPNTYEVSDIISSFVYRRGFGIDARADYSFSTAVDLFNAVINLMLLTGANALARRFSETSLW